MTLGKSLFVAALIGGSSPVWAQQESSTVKKFVSVDGNGVVHSPISPFEPKNITIFVKVLFATDCFLSVIYIL